MILVGVLMNTRSSVKIPVNHGEVNTMNKSIVSLFSAEVPGIKMKRLSSIMEIYIYLCELFRMWCE